MNNGKFGLARRIGRVMLGVACAMSVVFGPWTHAQASEYGKRMVFEHELDEAQIQKFHEFSPSKPLKAESQLVNAALADTETWSGAALQIDSKSNPYTIVLTVTGTAASDGEVTSMWQSGWADEEGTRQTTLFPGLAKDGLKAGEAFSLTKASVPTSFREDRTVYPVLELVNMNNMQLSGVKVQVWSGVGESTWAQRLLSFPALLTGVVLLALVLWLRRR